MTDSESPSPGHDSDTFDRNGSPLSDVSSPADTNSDKVTADDSSLTDTEAALKAQLAGFVEDMEASEGSSAAAGSVSATCADSSITTVVTKVSSDSSSTTIASSTSINATTSINANNTPINASTTSTGSSTSTKSLTPAQSLARKLSEKPPTKLYKKTQTNRRRSPPVASNGPIAIAPAPVLRPLLPKPIVPIRPKKRAKSVASAPQTVAPAAVAPRRKTQPAATTISPSSLSLPSKRKSSDVSTDSSLEMMLTPATTMDMSLDMSLNLDISQPNLDFWPDDLEWQDSGIAQPKELNLEDIFYDLDEQIIA
ncbi:hypothetical protein CJU89_2152 [Yarrowia sp. B02]|nr:hypothetical protein CJU89_2152 [Yarrowia sp. B02]